MTYRLEYHPNAIADLKKIDKGFQKRILKKIDWLAANFEQITPQPLAETLSGFYKLRIGDYRVIYSFDPGQQLLWIEAIGHRRDIYR